MATNLMHNNRNLENNFQYRYLGNSLYIGFLINFISEPVISGFISAAAITIASSQLKGLFGLQNLKTRNVVDTWYQICINIGDTHWPDLVLGISCIVILIFMKKMRTIKWQCLTMGSPTIQTITNKTMFFLSVARNALIVFISSIIAFSLNGPDQPFTLTGNVTAGLPSIQVPPFSTVMNNQTMTLPDMLGDIGIGIAMVPFIAILDTIAVVSASAKGKSIDATQEIITLGVINFLGSFISSLPTTASLSRTAINRTSGVKTPASGLVTGCIVLLALVFLTPFFKFIPKATLSAVIICAVVAMVEYEHVLPIWRSKKVDLIPLFITFLACLFIGLEWGLLLGIALHISMLLFSYAKPEVHTVLTSFPNSGLQYVLVTPTNGMSFPNAEHIRSAITKAGTKTGEGRYPVVINSSLFRNMDFTSAKGLKETIEAFEVRNQSIIFLHLEPTIIKTIGPLKNVATCCSLTEVQKYLENLEKENNSNREQIDNDTEI